MLLLVLVLVHGDLGFGFGWSSRRAGARLT